MTLDDAVRHLRNRTNSLSNLPVDRYPAWDFEDYQAVVKLLNFVEPIQKAVDEP